MLSLVIIVETQVVLARLLEEPVLWAASDAPRRPDTLTALLPLDKI